MRYLKQHNTTHTHAQTGYHTITKSATMPYIIHPRSIMHHISPAISDRQTEPSHDIWDTSLSSYACCMVCFACFALFIYFFFLFVMFVCAWVVLFVVFYVLHVVFVLSFRVFLCRFLCFCVLSSVYVLLPFPFPFPFPLPFLVPFISLLLCSGYQSAA